MHAHPLNRGSEEEQRRSWRWFLVCCFALICGVRFLFLQRFSGPASFFADDLEAIAHRILLPFEKGTLEFATLFTPHNGDHVIFVTRVWELFWYALNGEWDVQMSMMVKAPIFAAAMTLFIHILVRGLDHARFFAGAALAVLFAFPFNYHNLLWAFQSQFDFFFLAVALGWLALLNGKVFLALLAAFVAPFTLGAGPILAASYVPYMLVVGLLGRRWAMGKTLGLSALAIAIMAMGLALPDDTAAPREGTLPQKVGMLFRLLAWPFSNLMSAVERLPEVSSAIPPRVLHFPSAESSWITNLATHLDRYPILLVVIHVVGALFIVAPLATLVWLVVRQRLPGRIAAGPVNVAVFAGLMITATALARANMETIALRFIDHTSLVSFTSLVAACALWSQVRRARTALAIWMGVLALGYVATMGATLSQMIQRRDPVVSLEIVQRYYAPPAPDTNRAAILKDQAYERFFMGGDLNAFLAFMDDPELRMVLPKVFTEPNASPGRVAVITRGIGHLAWVIVVAAAVGGGGVVWRVRRGKAAAVSRPAIPGPGVRGAPLET